MDKKAATAATVQATTNRSTRGAAAMFAALFGLVALAAGATANASPPPALASGPSAQTGGRICFVGIVYAPQIEVSSRTMAIPSSDVRAARVASKPSFVEVTFTTPTAGVVSGAEVALRSVDDSGRSSAVAPSNLAVRFVDGSGSVHSAGWNGGYRVGRTGGVLTLWAKDGNENVAALPVIIVISYD